MIMPLLRQIQLSKMHGLVFPEEQTGTSKLTRSDLKILKNVELDIQNRGTDCPQGILS